MKAVVAWEGPEEAIKAALAALSYAAGWLPNDERSELEAAAYLINAFVRDVTITNLKLASGQTAEELEAITGAADSIKVSFSIE